MRQKPPHTEKKDINDGTCSKTAILKDTLARLGGDDSSSTPEPQYKPNTQASLANPTGAKTHLIQEGGDGSLALCGEQSPTQTTFLVTDATCPQCLAAHEKQMETVPPFSGNGGKPGNSASPS
jgi:hypothetical protein